MKPAAIKNLLFVIVRLVVTFLWVVTGYIYRRLEYYLVCSRLNPYLPKVKRECAIQQILSAWEKKSNRTIANDRQKFEATKWGQQAIRSCADRHLYAVLCPTRKENLERIANVLRAMDAEAFARVMRNTERIRCGKH